MAQKTKTVLTFALVFLLGFIVFSTWFGVVKQIRSAKGNVNSMRQLAAGFPHMFYPNYYYDIRTLSEKFRQIQKKEDIYYSDTQVFRSDVLQMATAPTKIKPLEPFPSQSAFVVLPKENFKSENQIPNFLRNCKPVLEGTYFSISHCEKL